MMGAWLRAGLAWPWADVKRHCQMAKSPVGHGGQGEGLENGEERNGAPVHQPRTQGQQEESSYRGVGAWRRGTPALCRWKDPGKHSGFPMEEWGVPDIFKGVKSAPGKSFIQSLLL